MKTESIQKIAIFLIMLVISIPIYSAQVYASINTYSTNKDGIVNYRAVSDSTTVVAEIPKGGVSPSSVQLLNHISTPFTSCSTTDSSKSICKYEYTQGLWREGEWGYSVSTTDGDSGSGSVIVDNMAPNITINSVRSLPDIEVDYTLSDYAFNGQNRELCSNINRVNFLLAGSVIKTQSFNLTPGTACLNDHYVTNMSAPSTNGIAKSFCIEAIDNVGNRGVSCQDIIIDKEPPEASNVALYDSSNQKIDYVASKTGSISAQIGFNLKENSITDITADASDFSIYDIEKQQLSSISMNEITCNPPANLCNGNCECRVPIKLNLPEGGNPVLKLRVTDSSNNLANLQLPITVLKDNDAPQVSSLTGTQCGDKNAVGPGLNTITANIEEAGSGLSTQNIFIDLSPLLGESFKTVFPTSCDQSGTLWQCKWGPFFSNANMTISGNQMDMNIVYPSRDNAGNYFSYAGKFFYDSNPPVVNSKYDIRAAVNTPGESFGEELTQYPVSGGTIDLTIQASDDLPLTATADFSAIASISTKTVTCTGTGTQTCKFQTIGPIKQGPITDAPIGVIITDCVGNQVKFGVKINVSVINQTINNFWNYAVPVGPSPPSIDKQTITVFPHKVYFSVPLSSPLGAQAIPISQRIESCSGKTEAGADVTDYIPVNTAANKRIPELIGAPSTNPLVLFKMQRADPPATLTFNCMFRTITQAGGVISQPEYDNVSFTLNFSNSPLGTIEQSLKDKVNKVKNSPLVNGKLIGQLQNILNALQGACNIYNLIAGISTTLTTIDIAIQTIATGAPPVKPAATVLQKSSDLLAKLTTIIGTTVGWACPYISCSKTPLYGDAAKKAIENIQGDLFLGTSKTGGLNLNKAFGVNTVVNPKEGISTMVDPRQSLIVSAATLCIPGVISNLQKARQIECGYIYCIRTNVPNGIPPYYCELQRASAWCKYVWGEIFQFIPWVKFIDKALDYTKRLITDPLYDLSVAVSLCINGGPFGIAPGFGSDIAKAICTLGDSIAALTSTAADLFSVKKTFFSSPDDICENEIVKRDN